MFSRPRARIIRCRVSIIVMCDRYSIGVLEDLVVIESIFMKQRTVWPAGIFFLNKLFQHWLCLRCEEFLEFSHPNRALMLLSSCLELFQLAECPNFHSKEAVLYKGRNILGGGD